MVLPASTKTARRLTERPAPESRRAPLSPHPLAAVLLEPVAGPRALAMGLGEGQADPGEIARRDVVLLDEVLDDQLPVGVLGADQRGHLRPAGLTGPRLDEPLVVLPETPL